MPPLLFTLQFTPSFPGRRGHIGLPMLGRAAGSLRVMCKTSNTSGVAEFAEVAAAHEAKEGGRLWVEMATMQRATYALVEI